MNPLLSSEPGTEFHHFGPNAPAIDVRPPKDPNEEAVMIRLVDEGVLIAYNPEYLTMTKPDDSWYHMQITRPAIKHLRATRRRARYAKAPQASTALADVVMGRVRGTPGESGRVMWMSDKIWGEVVREVVEEGGVTAGKLLEASLMDRYPRGAVWVMVVWEFVV